jgi:hypothetical protein
VGSSNIKTILTEVWVNAPTSSFLWLVWRLTLSIAINWNLLCYRRRKPSVHVKHLLPYFCWHIQSLLSEIKRIYEIDRFRCHVDIVDWNWKGKMKASTNWWKVCQRNIIGVGYFCPIVDLIFDIKNTATKLSSS